MRLITTSFSPSGMLYKDLLAFLRKAGAHEAALLHVLTIVGEQGDMEFHETAETCQAQLKTIKLNGVRQRIMSQAEFQCICSNVSTPCPRQSS